MTPAVDARHYRTATGRRPPFNLANYMSAELSANIAYRLFNQKAVGRFSVTVVLATAITSGNSSSSRDGMTAETSPTRHRSSSIAEDSTVYGQVWRSVILRYLGVHITAGSKFCCSLSNAKRSFYRAFNCILAKLVASHMKMS